METEAKEEIRRLVGRILGDNGFLKHPPSLYHYTDSQGFEGIVSTNSLWATNAKFLNDASEGRYGCELALPILRSRHEHAKDDWKKVLGNARLLLGDKSLQLEQDVPEEFTDAYVCCFCEHGDLLSQWRTYGAAGGGYSMEFAFPLFRLRRIFCAT